MPTDESAKIDHLRKLVDEVLAPMTGDVLLIVPPLAAIANAIFDATGQRFTDLPMSPRRVMETLHNLES